VRDPIWATYRSASLLPALEPGGARSCPSGALEIFLRVVEEVLCDHSPGSHRLDVLDLHLRDQFDSVVCVCFDDRDVRTMSDRSVASEEDEVVGHFSISETEI
jgi:hypothetical protein